MVPRAHFHLSRRSLLTRLGSRVRRSSPSTSQLTSDPNFIFVSSKNEFRGVESGGVSLLNKYLQENHPPILEGLRGSHRKENKRIETYAG